MILFQRGLVSIFDSVSVPGISILRRWIWDGESVIFAILELTAVLVNRETILELLRFTVDRLGTKSGCLGSRVYEAHDEQNTILYMERWASVEDLHRHIQSNLYRGVLNAMDLAEEPPKISFHEVSDTQSLELVVALRGSGAA